MPPRHIILITLLAALAMSVGMTAANTVTNRSAVITSAVSVGANTDYTLTATASLFSSTGSINIPAGAASHSAIVFKHFRPSAVISDWLRYVRIGGEAAVVGRNCQVKMHGTGTIVLPYGSDFHPLTCYAGTGFSGASCDSYSTGSSGGYMKTLTSSELLNNIRSFRLKRGYMVTFATGLSGYGYSRCFIADREDLEMDLPAPLAGKVSSYRLFVWQDAGKNGLASDASASVNAAVGSSWTYTWGVGSSMLPDVESVPHKIKKSWPGVADCGAADWSCHMKTDNEPANTSDEEPATVAEVLAYWEDAMRTGLRLLSPSSHDSGYTWQEQFMNAIDERGWRCDVLDMHCYWDAGSFSSIVSYYNKYRRPIWISEMLWGASWNSTGIFAATSDWDSNSASNQAANYNGAKPILEQLNACGYVERYAWWNGERNCSKVYCDGALTTLGSYYAGMDCGLAYDRDYEYVPAVVFKPPYGLVGSLLSDGSLSLSWTDPNGDMMDEIQVQCRRDGSSAWQVLARPAAVDKSSPADVVNSCTVGLADMQGCSFRVVDVCDGREYATSEMRLLDTDAVTELTYMPVNAGDYFYQVYSKEAATDLVWTLGGGSNATDVYYQPPATAGTDLTQLWTLEANSYGGYTMRSLAAMDYVMCSPAAWNFVTLNADYTAAAERATFLPEYTVSGDFWVVRNVGHGTYVGLWDNDKNFGAGERLAGNRTNATGTDSGDRVGLRAVPRDVVCAAQGVANVVGTFYLYNPEAGQFLTAANAWGTQSSLGQTGIDVAFLPDGLTYRLDTRISNGGDNHYFGTNLYLDSPAAGWTVRPAGSRDGRPTYALSTDGQAWLAAPDGPTTVLTTATSPTAARAQWHLFTRAELVERLAGATASNPADATFLLPGWGFGRNDRRNGSWEGAPTVGGDNTDMNGEKFNTVFDVGQQLEDIPHGVYEVTVQGFYRDGGYTAAAAQRAAGTEELNACLYIDDVELPLPSIFEGAGQAGSVGVATAYGYVPNTQTEASAYIKAGLYAVEPQRVAVLDGTMRIGIRKTRAVSNDWTLFDNFRLTYLGSDLRTGLATVPAAIHGQPSADQSAVCTLSGQKVSGSGGKHPGGTLPRGIYIARGRKLVVR